MKTIGILGGMGWEGSAAYYRVMNRSVRARLGGFHSARIILDSLDFEPIATAKNKAAYAEVQEQLVTSAMRLERAGADFVLIACNTVHKLAPAIEEAIAIPLLHIADVVGDALLRDGHRRVGLLGTRATVEASFYRKRLAASMKIEMVVPTPSMRDEVDRMISEELARGDAPQGCAERIDTMLEHFANEGCSALVLACTEFGLAFGSKDEPILQRRLPLYDSAVLHAVAAVDLALS